MIFSARNGDLSTFFAACKSRAYSSSVRSLSAKAGVLKKTTKKTTAKKTAARKPAATRSLSRPALPSEIQTYITFTGGSSANSQSIDAANELMEVLKSPTAIGVMRSQRIEPGK